MFQVAIRTGSLSVLMILGNWKPVSASFGTSVSDQLTRRPPVSISYYTDRREVKPPSRLMSALMVVNGLFAFATLLAWTKLAGIAAQPIFWATWSHVDPTDGILSYPFILLWLLPLSAIYAAWAAEKAAMRSLAWTWLWIPIVMHGLIMGWFYLAPPELL
jgi:hypothetical protein